MAETEQNKEFCPELAVLPLPHKHTHWNPQTREPVRLSGCRSRPPPAMAGLVLAVPGRGIW